jgi:hypothetical protein
VAGIPEHLGAGRLVEWERAHALLDQMPLAAAPPADAAPSKDGEL